MLAKIIPVARTGKFPEGAFEDMARRISARDLEKPVVAASILFLSLKNGALHHVIII